MSLPIVLQRESSSGKFYVRRTGDNEKRDAHRLTLQANLTVEHERHEYYRTLPRDFLEMTYAHECRLQRVITEIPDQRISRVRRACSDNEISELDNEERTSMNEESKTIGMHTWFSLISRLDTRY